MRERKHQIEVRHTIMRPSDEPIYRGRIHCKVIISVDRLPVIVANSMETTLEEAVENGYRFAIHMLFTVGLTRCFETVPKDKPNYNT